MKKIKVRLVAKLQDFHREEGLDCKETFPPVAKGESFRLALVIALRFRMKRRQLNKETAFPFADLEEVFLWLLRQVSTFQKGIA